MIILPSRIIAVGNLKKGPLLELFLNYKSRLRALELVEIKPSDKKGEERLFQKHIHPTDYVIALDEKGASFSSEALARHLFEKTHQHSALCFLIGGADGLSSCIKEKSHMTLCLGTLTWPHMLVRALLCEQIYRATSILNNHPYHRE